MCPFFYNPVAAINTTLLRDNRVIFYSIVQWRGVMLMEITAAGGEKLLLADECSIPAVPTC